MVAACVSGYKIRLIDHSVNRAPARESVLGLDHFCGGDGPQISQMGTDGAVWFGDEILVLGRWVWGYAGGMEDFL
jgi:hypothetical protein